MHPDTPFAEAAPDVAVGPDGIPFVVWDYGEIWWVKWDVGCSCWSTPATVNTPNSVSDEYPRISIGTDGIPWVVWSQYQQVETNWALLSSRYVNGSWTVPETVVAPVSSNDLYEIMALKQDDAWVASGPGLSSDIFVQHHENGRWVNRGWLAGGPGLDRDPSVAVDASGTVWVAWVYAGMNPWRVLVSRLVGQQWTPPDTMPVGRVLPELAAVGNQVFIIWRVDDPGYGSNIAYRIWENGWSPVGFVNEPDTTNTTDTSPSISAFADTGPVVAWSAGPTFQQDSRDIMVSHWTGSGWSLEETISIPDSLVVANDQYPQIALGPEGRAWASWERWGPFPQNQDFDIWYAQGQVYPPTTSVAGEEVTDSSPVRILWSIPNPSRGFSSTIFEVREAGRYEAIISDVAGRIVDRISLGMLEPGLYSGDRAFKWPLGKSMRPMSGVYFVRLEDVERRTIATSAKFVLLK